MGVEPNLASVPLPSLYPCSVEDPTRVVIFSPSVIFSENQIEINRSGLDPRSLSTWYTDPSVSMIGFIRPNSILKQTQRLLLGDFYQTIIFSIFFLHKYLLLTVKSNFCAIIYTVHISIL